MPVRKVHNRGGNIIGKFPSLKMKRMVSFESTIERDYLYLLDYEADITHFEEQPLTIEYQHGGKTRRYTPDFHITTRAGRNVLVECKPLDLINTDNNRRKFAAAREYCAGLDWDFAVATDHEIRSGFRLGNVKLLTRYACYTVRPETKGRIYALLQDTPTPLTVGQIQAAASLDPVVAFVSLMHMAFHHELAISLEAAPISANSPIYLPGQIPRGETV
jgi:hypothetical protein